MRSIKLLSASYHRNGIMGDGFHVGIFEDTDGSKKLFVDFGEDRFAVLDIAKIADGDIEFGSNSWRGDHYWTTIRDLMVKAGFHQS
jgi:hypothetical protein